MSFRESKLTLKPAVGADANLQDGSSHLIFGYVIIAAAEGVLSFYKGKGAKAEASCIWRHPFAPGVNGVPMDFACPLGATNGLIAEITGAGNSAYVRVD